MSTSSPLLIVRPDRALLPTAAPSTRYLLVRVVAPSAPPRDGRMPVNVSLVLDRSGSMEDGRKFTLARQAVEQALGMLRSDDCLDRKSTRLNSSHANISYAVFCLKKKK